MYTPAQEGGGKFVWQRDFWSDVSCESERDAECESVCPPPQPQPPPGWIGSLSGGLVGVCVRCLCALLTRWGSEFQLVHPEDGWFPVGFHEQSGSSRRVGRLLNWLDLFHVSLCSKTQRECSETGSLLLDPDLHSVQADQQTTRPGTCLVASG